MRDTPQSCLLFCGHSLLVRMQRTVAFQKGTQWTKNIRSKSTGGTFCEMPRRQHLPARSLLRRQERTLSLRREQPNDSPPEPRAIQRSFGVKIRSRVRATGNSHECDSTNAAACVVRQLKGTVRSKACRQASRSTSWCRPIPLRNSASRFSVPATTEVAVPG